MGRRKKIPTRKKVRGVTIQVSEKYYNELEKRKKEFIRKYNLNRLSTPAFTDIMLKQKLLRNAKKKK